jgi:hypothetical protein
MLDKDFKNIKYPGFILSNLSRFECFLAYFAVCTEIKGERIKTKILKNFSA